MDPGLVAKTASPLNPAESSVIARRSTVFPSGPGLIGLRGRTLVHANITNLGIVADLIDPYSSGIILTGNRRHRLNTRRVRSLATLDFRHLPLMRDTGAYYRRSGHGLFEVSDNLFGSGLGAALDEQIHNGFCAAITPTRYIPADNSLALEHVIETTDNLARGDTLCLLPLSVRWLSEEFLKRLDHALRYAVTPIGILFPHPRIHDPQGLARMKLHQLLTDHPGTCLLHTDLTGLASIARHGGFASIGASRPRWFAPPEYLADTGHGPHVLVPDLLQWLPMPAIRELAAGGLTYPCTCGMCQERSIHELDSPVTILRHNTARWIEWNTQLRLADDRQNWWRAKCGAALEAFTKIPWQETLRPHHTMLRTWSRM